MSCFSPINAFYRRGSAGSKGVLHLSKKDCKYPLSWYEILQLPCGKCIGCRLQRSREWANRLMCEAQSNSFPSWFVTLTYDNEKVPLLDNGLQTLNKRHCQLFFKKARKNVGSFRYYLAGEYGENTLRPHYHACLFGLNILDLVPYKYSSGSWLYNSPGVEQSWGLGHVVIAPLSWESSAYVARYTVKKVYGDDADAHYFGRVPEFALMSRKPGIGGFWYDEFHGDCFPSDELVIDNRVSKPPRYFFEKYRLTNPGMADMLKTIRAREVKPLSETRLAQLEEVAQLNLKRLNEMREI